MVRARLASQGPSYLITTVDGSLWHSGDSKSGIGNLVDETMRVDTNLIPADVNEIPIFATTFKEDAEQPGLAIKFSQVKQAGIRIKDAAGKILAEYELSTQFGEFTAAQLGSFVLDETGWQFVPVGVGFHGDFSTVLDHFS